MYIHFTAMKDIGGGIYLSVGLGLKKNVCIHIIEIKTNFFNMSLTRIIHVSNFISDYDINILRII